MKRTHFSATLFLLALIFVIQGCSAPVVKQEPQDRPATIREAEKKQTWELEWDKTVSEARKEKKVIIATGQIAAVRDSLAQSFKNRFNIEIEFLVGTGQELSNKITAQRKAGIFDIDLILTGLTTIVQVLKPLGVFEPLQPQLLLPDVLDTRNWYENKLQFVDKDGKVLFVVLSPYPNVFANGNQVKKGEISSYRDLLNPKWQGKMVMADPTVPGTGQEFIFVTVKSYGVEYLRELAKQNPVITRNDRLQVEWIAQGKYPIGIGGTILARDFMREGAPIFYPTITEGQNTLGPGFGGLALFEKAPHPNAARVYINWQFSPEGQIAYGKPAERQGVRADIPTDYLDPLLRRQPGVSYIKSSDEENLKIRDENLKISREVFSPLLR